MQKGPGPHVSPSANKQSSMPDIAKASQAGRKTLTLPRTHVRITVPNTFSMADDGAEDTSEKVNHLVVRILPVLQYGIVTARLVRETSNKQRVNQCGHGMLSAPTRRP